MKWKNCSIIILFLIAFFIHRQLTAQNENQIIELQKTIVNLVNDEHLKSASFSICIKNVQDGKIMAAYDANRSLIPASIQKILTTAPLLDKLGLPYRYPTSFYLKGINSPDSAFIGDIIVRPFADPSFCSPYQKNAFSFLQLADTLSILLHERGIKMLYGNILVEQNFIHDIPENPEWLFYDIGNYYGAGVRSLNFLENTCWISIGQQQQTDVICPIVAVNPTLLSPYFKSAVQSVNKKSNEDLYVIGSSYQNTFEVRGEMACCGDDTIGIKAAIPDPANTFQEMLKVALKDRGVFISRHESELEHIEESLLYQHYSPDLAQLAERALKKSVNLYCESFLHTYGAAVNETTDRAAALKALREFWLGKFSEEQGFSIVDGSGLSPKNMMTSMQMCDALCWIAKNKNLQNFSSLLPNANEEGVLYDQLKKYNKTSKYTLRLKSGSMEHVRAFAGYLLLKEKPKYAVSIIINHYDCKGDYVKSKMAKWFSEICRWL